MEDSPSHAFLGVLQLQVSPKIKFNGHLGHVRVVAGYGGFMPDDLFLTSAYEDHSSGDGLPLRTPAARRISITGWFIYEFNDPLHRPCKKLLDLLPLCRHPCSPRLSTRSLP